jgi:hypothetical protein
MEHLWCTNKPWANMGLKDSSWPELGGNHHLPLYNILCAWSRDQHRNVILFRDSQVGVSKFTKLKFLLFWKLIILCADLRLRWGLKQSFNHRQELSNDMWHTTYTLDLFFCHNLCFKYLNGSCKPISNISISRAF